jgi:hypothetical protein
MEQRAQVGAPTGLTVLANKQTAGRGWRVVFFNAVNDNERFFENDLFTLKFKLTVSNNKNHGRLFQRRRQSNATTELTVQ